MALGDRASDDGLLEVVVEELIRIVLGRIGPNTLLNGGWIGISGATSS